MTQEQENAAYYAVVPAPVRYDPELSPNAKLLFCEITSLCKAKGYCWATNSYFAKLFALSAGTISRLISQLERRGHIATKTVATETGSERRIYTDVFRVERIAEGAAEGGTQKPQAPLDENGKGGVRKNRKQNDHSVNDHSEYPPVAPQPGGAPSEPASRRRTRQKKSIPTHAPERFEQFWAVYPVGGSRLKAVEAWDALAPSEELIDEMARALKRQMRTRAWRDGIGIPHACRWLSNQRWTDKLPEEPAPQNSGGWADDPEVCT